MLMRMLYFDEVKSWSKPHRATVNHEAFWLAMMWH